MVWLRYWYRYGDYAKMTERLGMVSINIDKGVTTMVQKKAQGSRLKTSVLKWFENTKKRVGVLGRAVARIRIFNRTQGVAR